ncbi:MAG TPA: trypsin-like peptidase domain-containing protein [Ferruginibacter sp.]|jgi:S1-C subfamily serine protease|nr:trypsin-like peptidase domain-containing protein [Ferruginibacter sp.]MBN8699038.1 trypsin-like peptidase domain-containing protein [Chitinophagales bacterium]TXH30165.1 MAG: FHA domain-containing protein [Cyclobacteriaceae bacterium]HNF44201.1 trypsin-like peptidase domain-containing protein [Ferruginibacter sp.]HQQ99392.1 trypsin-like peptidase domain-containing protein [Ferruginibacter sp.]
MSTTIERYVIRHISGTKANQVEEFDFSKNELSIGRTAGSDIQFDPEQEVIVSREHGKIVKVSSEPPQFSINDNNSRNGIFVNKMRVKGSAPLKPGDEVQLGSNGPVFSFDIHPRPQNMMMETKVMDIPTSIKATTVSEVASAAAEPAKTGLGKQTVERMLVAERKKSFSSMAYILGALIIVLGALGYFFRDKIFGKNTTTIVNVGDSSMKNKKAPDVIAKENNDKVVQIEFGWQLIDANSGQELWHQYMAVKDQSGQVAYRAVYIENGRGEIEPYLDLQKNVQLGVPLGIAGASGSGFVVSADGFILTNRHVAASWNTRYGFPDFAFPGILIRNINGRMQTDPNYQVMPQDVGSYVPANATMVGGRQAAEGSVKGKNTYMNVIFANTALRRPVQSATPSDQHDVAMIKVELPTSLSPVTMKDNYDAVKPGQTVTVMGYPGVAPDQYVVRKSNDPFNPKPQVTTIPTPTVTTGNIGRIVPASSDKTNTYSGFGDSYQLTINATGAGNSGGPMFDDEGNVIGIYYAGKSDARGTQISFAIPIKYGMELMGIKKVQ